MTGLDIAIQTLDICRESVEEFTVEYLECVAKLEDVSEENKLMIVLSVEGFARKLLIELKRVSEHQKFKESMNNGH
jgi:predicted amidophosphoribosyltransferase